MTTVADNAMRSSYLSSVKRALLEERLRGRYKERFSTEIIPRRPASDVPLSYAQQRLWFLEQLEPGNVAYNFDGAYRLVGQLSRTALVCSINEIVRRHEVLRTVFSGVAGKPVQVILPELDLSIPVMDLRVLPLEAREAEVRRLAAEEAEKPFNLETGPLVRVVLLDLGVQSNTAEPEHVVLFTLHHIVADGWSMGIVFREFVALYQAYCVGEPSPLSILPIQYADYAVWQRQWLQGDVLERQQSYWKEQLAGAPEVLALPTDRPRPELQSYRGARYGFMLPKDVTEALVALSRRESVTLFAVLLAAFNVLVSRYTGEQDVCIGTPIANRNRLEIEGLIGFFVNTLVLRTDLSSNPTLTELLARVRAVCLGAQAHQDVPFEKLVEELQPTRNASHTPLFQIMFVMHNVPTNHAEVAGLSVSSAKAETQTAKFDMTLDLTEEDGGLEGGVEYNTDLFDESTIIRLANHFEVLLEGIVAHPESRLSELPLLTASERQQLLVEWNATATEYPKDKCIHQLFETQVERTPEACAVVYEEQSLTYRELNAKANQLAHHLHRLGVGPDTLVGICVERSLEMVIGLLGVLKAGGAYVPLDPTYPKERLAYMLEDAQPSVLLTQARLRDALPAHVNTLCLDSDWISIGRRSKKNPANVASPLNLAYVIYTSGSTGRPKGVATTHQAVVRLVKNTNYARLGSEEVFLQFAPLAFDASTFEIWAALANGACIVSAPARQLTLDELGEVIRRHAITTVWLTSALFSQMVEHRLDDLRGVRQLLAGGDVLPVYHVRKLRQLLPTCQVINGYGPTENTTFSTCHPIGLLADTVTAVPIGKPIANSTAYVLDGNLYLTPVGVPGELYIGGAGLARGYLNRPELTAERFIPNPFSNQPGERLYRTGDLARYRPDGNLEYLGRTDHQVKVRGFRIELGEVEARLLAHSQVKEAVVLAREDFPGEKRLVGYVVGQAPVPSVDELCTHIQQTLPEYMVPGALVFLDALPLTPNGKVDRKALPDREVGKDHIVRRNFAHRPRDTTELRLITLWERVLKRYPIGIHDDFFRLGGYSLLAYSLISEIHKKFDVHLPLSSIFHGRTIADMSRLIHEANKETAWSPIVPIRSHGAGCPIFCVHALDGNALCYVELSNHLDHDQVVFGVQARGQGYDNAEPFDKVEDMSSYYCDAVRAIQPRGPYRIVGYSFGGLVAFELAWQLEQLGEKIDLLFIIDTDAPNRLPTKESYEGDYLADGTDAALLVGLWPELELSVEELRSLSLDEKLLCLIRRASELNLLANGFGLEQARRLWQVIRGNAMAIANYEQKQHSKRLSSGRLCLCRADINENDRTLGWDRFASGGVDVVAIPDAKHDTLLTPPHVERVAQQLQRYLHLGNSSQSYDNVPLGDD